MRFHPVTRRFALGLTAAALVLSACSSIDSKDSGSSGSGTDTRPVKDGGTLRVALSAEPDKLDPTLARTLVGRTIFTAICQKLYDVDEELNLQPQLADGLPTVTDDGKTVTIKVRQGVKFADGTPLDANAVKTSLDRHRSHPESARKSELSSVASVDATDSSTVTIHLSEPFAPLTAVLADRAGMILSPKAIKAKGDDFGTAPVCVGPFKFATRIAQDRIEVVKDPNYYDADQVHLDKIVYRIIADANTRFTNLRSGDVEVLDTVATTDVAALKGDSKLRLLTSDSLGYQGITINVGNVKGIGNPPGKLSGALASPLATDPRVRKAFELSIDRVTLNRVVFRSQFKPACGPISDASKLSSDESQACSQHDPDQAKKLLAEAGVKAPLKVSLIIGNTPEGQRLGEAIKSMAAEGGFDIQLQPVEFASSLDQTDAGKFQMFAIGWSGRVDPDGNITPFVSSLGSQNIAGYSNPEIDKLLGQARATGDEAQRKALYGQLVTKLREDAPLIYLYRQRNLTGVSSKVAGVRVFGDGVIRLDRAGFAK